MSSRKDMIGTATIRQKEHEYNLLADGDRCQVWLCQNPRTVTYGFVIAEHPWGVSVMGDIGNVQFYGVGLEGLARGDVEYYIKSKVIGCCMTRAKDKDIDLQLLHMVSHAAKQIQSIKKKLNGVKDAHK